MSYMKNLIQEHIHSSAHLSKKHIHPRLQKLFEIGGFSAVFDRAEGQYLYDQNGERYLDFLTGGGVMLLGRNHPVVTDALKDVLELDLPNMTVVNASVLGGLLAERLIELAGPDVYSKVLFGNSGTESTDLSLRFARFLTGRRRFLYLEGAFHGRTYAAISCCGMPELRDGMEPLMPVCTSIPPNDIRMLKRELEKGDVAGFIYEPVQGMTLNVLTDDYLREAEILCRQHGTVMIADEVQTGLGRGGNWFCSTAAGIQPDIITISKILSGGQVPVAAVIMREEVYEAVFKKFKAGPIYFSTFAQNNLAMAAGIATVDALREIDAPARSKYLSQLLREGMEALADRYDCIDRVAGKGLMLGVYFKQSENLSLGIQQKLMDTAEPGSFGAAVNVDLYARHRILCQIPGPGLDAIKILPPVVATEEDVEYFLTALEDTLASYYTEAGPIRAISRGFVKEAMKQVKGAVPTALLSSLGGFGQAAAAQLESDTTHTPSNLTPVDFERTEKPALMESEHYAGAVNDHADVVIVGSGPGGAVLARSLALKGKKVIVVEQGPVLRQHDFSRDIGETLAKYFEDGGLRATRGNVAMPSLIGRVLGGGSVFNSAICLRMPDWTAERWRRAHAIEGFGVDDLAPYFDEMDRVYNVHDTEDEIQGPRNLLFKLGAERMGYGPKPLPRSTDGCKGSGQCLLGCRNGAKMSMDRRGIPEVLENGGRVYTSVRVEKLLSRGDRIAGISGWVIDPETRKRRYEVRITADCTVIAAGAFASPVLLRKSGLKHQGIGEGLRAHPSSMINARFNEDVLPWTGATQGVHVPTFLERGIKLESVWTTTAFFAGAFKGVGSEFLSQVKDFRNYATWAAWCTGEDSIGRVRVTPTGRPDYRFDLGIGDARRLQDGVVMLSRMAFAAGAWEVHTMLPGEFGTLYGEDDIARLEATRLSPEHFQIASNHVFGTTAMGGHPDLHPCDSLGRVRGTRDLYVCDTGALPESPGLNPMYTLMAHADRLGAHIADTYVKAGVTARAAAE